MAKLIVNADDFGYAKMFNKGTLEMMREGIVTSTTVMVNRVCAAQEEQLAELIRLRREGRVSVGLHFEADLKRPYAPQFGEQVAKFEEIFGERPSHLDIHKYVLNNAKIPLIEAEDAYAAREGFTVRNHGIPINAKHTRYPAYDMSGFVPRTPADTLTYIDESVGDGETYELMCHPGYFDPDSQSSFNKQREDDLTALRLLKAHVEKREDIELVTYRTLR